MMGALGFHCLFRLLEAVGVVLAFVNEEVQDSLFLLKTLHSYLTASPAPSRTIVQVVLGVPAPVLCPAGLLAPWEAGSFLPSDISLR